MTYLTFKPYGPAAEEPTEDRFSFEDIGKATIADWMSGKEDIVMEGYCRYLLDIDDNVDIDISNAYEMADLYASANEKKFIEWVKGRYGRRILDWMEECYE